MLRHRQRSRSRRLDRYQRLAAPRRRSTVLTPPRPNSLRLEVLEQRFLLASIPTSLDLSDVRAPLSDEGLLSHVSLVSDGGGGEERTGWIDIRHPGYYDGASGPTVTTTDSDLGYERSDHWVDVQNVVLTDSTATATASPDIEGDFDLANQIFAQLGISVVNEANLSAQDASVTFPLTDAEARLALQNNRSANAETVNNDYVQSLAGGDDGLAFSPEDFTPSEVLAPGFLLSDSGAGTDVFAHELSHFLIDNHRFDNAKSDVLRSTTTVLRTANKSTSIGSRTTNTWTTTTTRRAKTTTGPTIMTVRTICCGGSTLWQPRRITTTTMATG